jgi:hypothetical protein
MAERHGQMTDKLIASIEALSARWAAWHNDAAATPRFVDEGP